MPKSQIAPNGAKGKLMKAQRSVMTSDFAKVTLVKELPEVKTPSSMEEVLALVGNSQEKLFAAVAAGISEIHRSSPDGWMQTDDEGNVTGPFAGSILSDSAEDSYNKMVLNLAKAQPIYDKDKGAAKEAARNFIKSNPAILTALLGQLPTA